MPIQISSSIAPTVTPTPGSTYTLTYDPAKDVLRGVYYQAVARQRYDIYFERAK